MVKMTVAEALKLVDEMRNAALRLGNAKDTDERMAAAEALGAARYNLQVAIQALGAK